MVERVDLPRLDLAAIDREFAYVIAEGRDRVGESATGLDFGELVVVADQDHLGTRVPSGGDDVVEVDGATHPGFVDDDDGVAGEWMMATVMVEAGNRERRDAGAGLEFARCAG